MSSVEILSQLTTKAVSLSPTIGGKSIDSLSRIEIAGLLSGLGAAETNLALAKYCGDPNAACKLHDAVVIWVANQAQVWKWNVKEENKKIIFGELAWQAISDCIDATCKKCKGTKLVKLKACTVCNSTGVKYLSDREMASMLQVSPPTYAAVWKGRYQEVFRYVCKLDSEVCFVVFKNSRE